MENLKPQKGLIDSNGVLLKTPGILRHERSGQEAKETLATEGTTKGLLDRSKLTEARKTRLEGEIDKAGEKPKEEVLDRARIAEQRQLADEARIKEIKGTIEERLNAVEKQVGIEEKKPFSKEGLLDRNFGK